MCNLMIRVGADPGYDAVHEFLKVLLPLQGRAYCKNFR